MIAFTLGFLSYLNFFATLISGPLTFLMALLSIAP